MGYPLATRLVSCDIQKRIKNKWSDFIDGENGCFYGIPFNARRVLQFDKKDKTVKEIGPDLGRQGWKYVGGIKADSGSIYCIPYFGAECFLKITPMVNQDAEVQILKDKQIQRSRWRKGALAEDGCIYYLPYGDSRILKLDPNDGDSLSLVGGEIGGGFSAVVLGKDGCIYGISMLHIIKFNIVDYSISQKDLDQDEYHDFDGAVLGKDGNIYAANQYGQILKGDTANNDWGIIGGRIYIDGYCHGWGRPLLGDDKCLYFPPACHDRVLTYNPVTQNISFIGESYGTKQYKWVGAALASDGYIYCIPYNADNILMIDGRHLNEKILEVTKNVYEVHKYCKEQNLIQNMPLYKEKFDVQITAVN